MTASQLDSTFRISKLAIPAVSFFIAFIGYSSQLLLRHLEPGPLSRDELIKVNVAVSLIWICYYQACMTDPRGSRYAHERRQKEQHDGNAISKDGRWCHKCDAYKPPRAHHCKNCGSCIPKMDHHCPWTSNCVSHFTYPHFMRFIFYAILGMSYMEYLLIGRASIIWEKRYLSSYLGPTVPQLTHLFILLVSNSFVLLALIIIFLRSGFLLVQNITTIESWEIERHETLVSKARSQGGYLDGPGGVKIRIRKQEFPYDIGIWKNIAQGMGGTFNPLFWFYPFASTPPRASGVEFEVNGFEDKTASWPPPDPSRMSKRRLRLLGHSDASEEGEEGQGELAYTSWKPSHDPYNQATSLEAGQQEDSMRRRLQSQQQNHWSEQKVENGDAFSIQSHEETDEGGQNEEPISDLRKWKNTDGECLRDYGVDEDAEFKDEDDDVCEWIEARRI